MKPSRPGVLAVRCVNQYRRRDVLTYLALRYYLDNSAAQPDEWARRVAVDLVLTRSGLPYFRSEHFKEIGSHGQVVHRSLFIPGANEALAEAALLDECAKYPRAFGNLDCVFSYLLTSGDSRSGIFSHYVNGLHARHAAIAETCIAIPTGVVRYTDVKSFYPNITGDLAQSAWRKQCDSSGISQVYRELGERLIRDHETAGAGSSRGLLTGPMLSHLLANLVLRDLDEEFSTRLPARYFRYVDDMTLVGGQDEVTHSLGIIRSRLGSLGLSLHDDDSPKNLTVTCSDWLQGRDDFRQSRREVSWMTLIGDLKRFLLSRPDERDALHAAFLDEGFRIPVRDYSGACQEMSYLQHILRWSKKSWFRYKNRSVTIASLLNQARILRGVYERRLREHLEGALDLAGFDRKRRVPKLRYWASRLIYLAADDPLLRLSELARELPELRFHAEVMRAVADGNVDQVLRMGTNAAQAAAQPLRAAGKGATTTTTNWSPVTEQSLAVFRLNGVAVELPNQGFAGDSELLRFATSGTDVELMKSGNPFIREIACLHGISAAVRHPSMLDLAFDEDEITAMDAVEQLQQSLSP
jgi:hypothetical protein